MPEAKGFEDLDTPDVQKDTPVTLKFPAADATKDAVSTDVHALIGELEDTANHPELAEEDADVSMEKQAA